jgi:hypothetical protein
LSYFRPLPRIRMFKIQAVRSKVKLGFKPKRLAATRFL